VNDGSVETLGKRVLKSIYHEWSPRSGQGEPLQPMQVVIQAALAFAIVPWRLGGLEAWRIGGSIMYRVQVFR